MESLLNHEENNRSITIKDLEEILLRSKELNQLDKIVKQEESITTSILINPSSPWRGIKTEYLEALIKFNDIEEIRQLMEQLKII